MREDASMSHFVVYRPGFDLMGTTPGGISIPIWAQIFYKQGKVVDVNIGIDLGEFTQRPKKRLSGIYVAPKLDDEGRRFIWASFEESFGEEEPVLGVELYELAIDGSTKYLKTNRRLSNPLFSVGSEWNHLIILEKGRYNAQIPTNRVYLCSIDIK